MALVENINKRTEHAKVFYLDGKELIKVHARPVHYNSGAGWNDVDIKLELVLANKEYNSQYLCDKNKWSYGFRNDSAVEKFYGIRIGNENQLEATLRRVEINGTPVVLPTKFRRMGPLSSTEIEHEINDATRVYTKIARDSFKNAIVTSAWAEQFVLEERLDLTGFTVQNPFVVNGSDRVYIPNAAGEFVLRCIDSTEELRIKPATMWNRKNLCVDGIDHSLAVSNGELVYSKRPNQRGINWLKLNKPPFYIDISIAATSITGLESRGETPMAAQSGGTISSASDHVGIVNNGVKANSYCYHAFLTFNTEAYYGYTVSSASIDPAGAYNNAEPMFAINYYLAANISTWSTSTANYLGQSATINTTGTVSTSATPIGSAFNVRCRADNVDVGNSWDANLTGTYLENTAQFSDGALIFTAFSPAIWFGTNF